MIAWLEQGWRSVAANAAAEWPLYALLALAMAFGLAADLLKGRNLRQRYLSRGVRTDLLYAVSALTHSTDILVRVPLTIFLLGWLASEAPWLRVEVLAVLPAWTQLALLFVLTDFYAYFYHRLQHANRYLWQFHKVHHSQRELTALSTFRQSILDQIVNLVILIVPSALMATSATMPVAVILIFQCHQTLLHTNTGWTFGPLGWLIVSPGFHEVHHSTRAEHVNRNYGPVLAIWDRLFGSYSPRGTGELRYGLDDEPVPESFFRQMLVPAVGLWRQFRADLSRARPTRTADPS